MTSGDTPASTPARWLPGSPILQLLALLPMLLVGLGTPVLAQSAAGDAGTFRVSVGGHPVGTEEFSIRQGGVGANAEIVAIGRVQLDLATGSLELAPRLRTTGFQANPVSYEVTVGGDSPQRITGTVGSGRFSARIVTPSGEQMREYVATTGATVLDDAVAHHYYFLARRLHSGRIPIIIPRENRQVMATVTNRGEERITVAGTPLDLFHLVVQPDGGEERHVWVDALNRVIRVQIPGSGYLAERTEIPR